MKNAQLLVETDIQAPVGKVWEALVNRESLKQFMMGADVISDWKEGSSVVWKATLNGMYLEDKGEVLKVVPKQLLRYTHYSKLSRRPDLPENYYTVTISLSDLGEDRTKVSVSQTNHASDAELRHNVWGWNMILGYLKRLLEKSSSTR